MGTLKIGLTGGIGSGKTSVASVFKVLGIPVFDADREAKLIMEKDEELASSIKRVFGKETYINKKLNRFFLANLVFNDPFKLAQLNALVHPKIINVANNWMKHQNTSYVIKEAALMFETGSAADLDFVIGVQAPKNLRLERVMERDNVTSEQVLERMNRQISEVIKMKLCDFVIVNDEAQLLIPQVLRLHDKFLQIAEQNNF